MKLFLHSRKVVSFTWQAMESLHVSNSVLILSLSFYDPLATVRNVFEKVNTSKTLVLPPTYHRQAIRALTSSAYPRMSKYTCSRRILSHD